jgi:ABC-2 type transport system permease protein
MNAIWTVALKDLKLLTRDRLGMFWILGFPLMYALFLGAIFGGSGQPNRALTVAVIDEDDSPASQAFIERLKKSEALTVRTTTLAEARDAVRHGNLVAYVVVPTGFGKASFFSEATPTLQVGIDPTRRAEAGFLQGILMESAYAGLQEQFMKPQQARSQIEESIQRIDQAKDLDPARKSALKLGLGMIVKAIGTLDEEALKGDGNFMDRQPIKLETTQVTNDENQPRSPFEITFPSSILWGLMGCVSAFSIAIVTERQQGTLLRLRVAPVTWGQLLAGKGMACFLSCTGVAVGLLAIARLFLGVRLENLPGLALGICCTAFCFTGLAMLFSTLGKTEASVAGAGWGIMMPLAMLGGGMVPLIAMPGWMQVASNFSPVKWGIVALEGAIWRGYSLSEMLLPCAILLAVGATCLAAGVRWLSRQGV